MSFIKTIRAWLQKPWFVGALGLVALAYVGRNIVLPIVRMTSGGSYAQSQGEPASRTDTTSPTSPGASLVAGALSAIDGSTLGATPPKDFRRLRDTMLGEVSDTFTRNPFLAANDPRQPNARPSGLGSMTDPSLADDRGGEAEAPRPLIAADLGLQLSAIVAGPSGNLALINRRVMGVGDEISAQLPEQSGLAGLFGPSTRDRTLRVDAIHATEVLLSGSLGRFRLQLEDAADNP